MAFNDGDFIEIEYSIMDAASNTLIETTDEKLARGANIYHEHERYGKKLVILGFNRIIKGLDREIRKMSVNEQKTFDFKPDEAFGQRSEELVRIMRASDMKERGVDPYPGMRLDLDGVHATVRSVNSGRVTVDANHPYAGRNIKYELKVVGHPVNDEEKVASLSRAYDLEPSSMKLDGKQLTLDYGASIKKDEEYFVEKTGLVHSILDNMKIDEVTVQEHYKREIKEETKGAPSEKRESEKKVEEEK